jgi:hypothetical protein
MAEIKITVGVKPEREHRGMRYRGIATVGDFNIETPITYQWADLARYAITNQAKELAEQLKQGRAGAE